MITGIQSDKILFPQGIAPGYVYFTEGKILSAGKEKLPCDRLLDYRGSYVAPGFVDLHTHGALGFSFLDCTEEEANRCCEFHMGHGTTTIYPTFSAAPIKDMEKAVAMVAEMIEKGSCPISIPGVHMEGPYLSVKQAGAQLPGVITAPVSAEYQGLVQRWGRYIARWTYAPEQDEDLAFTRFLEEKGILASAGHTDARYEELKPAFDRGCRLITHLYSCTSTITREQGFRHLGVIETAYLLTDMDAEIIADGCHLPPELIQLIVKIKGKEHVVLCTDSVAPTGLPYQEGVMRLGAATYIVEDGVAKLPDRTAFHGSIATTDRLVRVLTKDCGIPLTDAVYMLTEKPAQLMGLKKGRLAADFDADIVVFDDDIQIQSVFAKGVKCK